MILYFSGTGNSRAVAQILADKLGQNLADIGAYLKQDLDFSEHGEEAHAVVCPTYAWRLPRAVAGWLDRRASFPSGARLYFVLTCGGDIGAAGKFCAELCARRGWRFMGVAGIVMPENYLALFPVPDEKSAAALVRAGLEKAEKVAEVIAGGYPIALRPYSLLDRLKSGPVNRAFYPLIVHDRRFFSTDACTACGLCEKACQFNNIVLRNGRPAWQGRCTHCMACIARCPAKAIEYGKATAGRRRHYLPPLQLKKAGPEAAAENSAEKA